MLQPLALLGYCLKNRFTIAGAISQSIQRIVWKPFGIKKEAGCPLDRMDWRASSVCARFKGVIYVWIPVGGFLQRNLERAVSIRKMQAGERFEQIGSGQEKVFLKVKVRIVQFNSGSRSEEKEYAGKLL